MACQPSWVYQLPKSSRSCYLTTHNWGQNSINNFILGISPKVNEIARQEFEHAYYDVIFQHVSYYSARTLSCPWNKIQSEEAIFLVKYAKLLLFCLFVVFFFVFFFCFGFFLCQLPSLLVSGFIQNLLRIYIYPNILIEYSS